MNKKIIIVVGSLAVAVFLGWLIVASSKPLPGQKIADLGRDHVTDISDVTFNSNPPTSAKVLKIGFFLFGPKEEYMTGFYQMAI